jgi:hypothetical protein
VLLVLPMLFGAFQPPSPHRAGPPRTFPGAENQELASILVCPAPVSTFSAAIRARFTLASPATCISVLCNIRRARGKVSLRPMAESACSTEGYEDIRTLLSGFGGRKAPNSMGKISIAEVLRLRATSAVSRNQSVRRSAQDDDSLEGIEKHRVGCKKHERSKKSQTLRMTILWGV